MEAPNGLPDHVLNNPDFGPFFTDCLGALDGTHCPVIVKSKDAPAYRCRHKCTCQNVLGVCTFEERFSFIHAGWEGTAHDSTVLTDALKKGLFSVPEGKYYLVDAGYALSRFFLAPYRGVRYHLKEWRQARDAHPDLEYVATAIYV
jgi:hypothetical protein